LMEISLFCRDWREIIASTLLIYCRNIVLFSLLSREMSSDGWFVWEFVVFIRWVLFLKVWFSFIFLYFRKNTVYLLHQRNYYDSITEFLWRKKCNNFCSSDSKIQLIISKLAHLNLSKLVFFYSRGPDTLYKLSLKLIGTKSILKVILPLTCPMSPIIKIISSLSVS